MRTAIREPTADDGIRMATRAAYIEHALLLHVIEETAARCIFHRDADEICGKEDFLQQDSIHPRVHSQIHVIQ